MATASNSPSKAEEQNLIVALRTRPLNEEEILNGATTICHCVDNKMVVLLDPQEDPDDILRANRTREKQFVFDHALDGTSSQEEVYQKTSQYVIPSVIQGYNATVFAYGATGAGKTYTMLGTDDEPGIMARSLNDLFKEMERCSENYNYSVSMTYLEIYNEMIRDLLNPETGYLELREDSKGVQVQGLKEMDAHTSVDVMQMLLEGNKERTQEPTAANKTSSRSHAVLQVNVKQRPRVHGTIQEVRTGKLFLIDLAGSERAAATHNRGKRMVEGAHINRSLLALGNCINALSDKNGAKYVNFRDSKLTRLLKDSLGGNCKTVMIAHVGPASIHFEETRNTLLYAERARNIKTKVKRNVMDVQYHIHQYTNIIAELREEVKRLRVKLDNQALNSSKNNSAIQAIQREVMESHRTSHLYQDQPVYQNGQIFIPGQGHFPILGHVQGQSLLQTRQGYFIPAVPEIPLSSTATAARPVSHVSYGRQSASRIPRPLSYSDGSVSDRRPVSVTQSLTSRNLSSAHSMRSIRSNVTALTEILEENANLFGKTEVLQATHREDQSGLNRLKEQLVTVFRDQMESRRSLMELDNTAMEIRLETARNQLLVQKYEKERALAKRRREREKENRVEEESTNGNDIDDENPKDATKEKSPEKSRSELCDTEEAEDVKNARYELIALTEERDRTEKLRAAVSKELENAREKASKIEELLPRRVKNSEQQEILSLLVKVHELEIDNMEMQSSCLLRNFEIRRKNMVLAKYQQHLSLCDEIIQQQKSLLDEYMVTSPKDLEELYELYIQEDDVRPDSVATSLPDPLLLNKGMSMTSMNRRMLESDSMSDMERLTVLNEEQSSGNNRILAPSTKRQFYRNMKPPPTAEEDKIFSRSAKAQEIRAAQAQDDAIHLTAMANNPGFSRQRSIITLSSHSTSPSPPVDPTPRVAPTVTTENKAVIASKTRNIAALAAARKNKAHLNAYNNERLATFASLQGRDNVLTTSRLAQHDKDFSGSEVTLNHLIDDNATNGTADDLLTVRTNNPQPTRSRYRNNNVQSRTSTQPPARKPVTVKKRARSQDISNYPSLSKATPIRRANDTTGGSTYAASRRQRIAPAATRTGAGGPSKSSNRNEDIREFESEQTPPTSVQQTNADKGRGLTIQKRVRGPAFGTNKSTSNTPRKSKTSKRPPPSIPAAYRKTDIAIAGFGLQK